MNANTIRLTEQRDEAQSQVRSLETDVRILRAARDDARENLRMAVHVLRCTASTANQSESGWTAPVYRDLLSDINNQVRAFLTRIDGATETKCARCGQVGIGRCGCGFQGETDGKAGAR